MVRALGAFLFAVCLASAGRVRADDGAVIAVGGHARVRPEDWDAAVVAASDEIERRGFTVHAGAARTRAQSPADCVDDACIEAERSRLGVTMLAVVSVFSALGTPEQAGSVSVTLVSPTGQYGGNAEIGDGTLDVAVRRAIAAAWDRSARGGQPWLTIQGQPEGALILIDGVERGALPWEGAVATGEHRIELRFGGYVTHTQTVTVGTAPALVDVTLVRTGGSNGPDVPWIVAGAASVAFGIGALSYAIVGATTDSCSASCSGGPASARLVSHSNDGGVIAWSVAGGIGLAFGAVGLVLGFVTQPSSSPVTLRPDGIAIAF